MESHDLEDSTQSKECPNTSLYLKFDPQEYFHMVLFSISSSVNSEQTFDELRKEGLGGSVRQASSS